jgi:hypothetical protein
VYIKYIQVIHHNLTNDVKLGPNYLNILTALHEGQLVLSLFSFSGSSNANLYELYNTDILSFDNVYLKGFRYGLFLRNIIEKCIIYYFNL